MNKYIFLCFFILMFYFLNHKTTILNIDILQHPHGSGKLSGYLLLAKV